MTEDEKDKIADLSNEIEKMKERYSRIFMEMRDDLSDIQKTLSDIIK